MTCAPTRVGDVGEAVLVQRAGEDGRGGDRRAAWRGAAAGPGRRRRACAAASAPTSRPTIGKKIAARLRLGSSGKRTGRRVRNASAVLTRRARRSGGRSSSRTATRMCSASRPRSIVGRTATSCAAQPFDGARRGLDQEEVRGAGVDVHAGEGVRAAARAARAGRSCGRSAGRRRAAAPTRSSPRARACSPATPDAASRAARRAPARRSGSRRAGRGSSTPWSGCAERRGVRRPATLGCGCCDEVHERLVDDQRAAGSRERVRSRRAGAARRSGCTGW